MKRLLNSTASICCSTLYYVYEPTSDVNKLKERIYRYITPANRLDNKSFQLAFIRLFAEMKIEIHHGNGNRLRDDLSNLYLIDSSIHSTLTHGYRQYTNQLPIATEDKDTIIEYITRNHLSVYEWGAHLRYRKNLTLKEYVSIIQSNVIVALPDLAYPTPKMVKLAEEFFQKVVDGVNKKLNQNLLSVGDLDWDQLTDSCVICTCHVYNIVPSWVEFDIDQFGGKRVTKVTDEIIEVLVRLKDIGIG